MKLYWIIIFVLTGGSGIFNSLNTSLHSFLASPPPGKSILMDAEFKYEYGIAQEYFSYEEYNTALPLFEKLLKYDPENCNLNFYVGVCYLNSSKERVKSIAYLEKASRKTSITYSNSYKEVSAPVFAFYHLGQAYHLNYQFNEAIKAYKRFQNYFSARTRDEEYLKLVKRMIEISNNAKELTAKATTVKITPVTIINSIYDDLNPAITPDGNELYFSSRRKGNLGATGIIDGGFADDVYSSVALNGAWQKPKAVRSTRMNSFYPDIMGGISKDFQYLFLSTFNGKHLDIYFCKQAGSKGKKRWANPVNINEPINSTSNEYAACMSPDGQTIYFVSDRAEGYGGKDIYSSQRISETKWAKPINLGPQINTPYDEETPYMSADGVTLYFSSNGHNTIGGLDIFFSTFENGNWSAPENIGVPINTTFDDSGYKLNADETKGYYATAKERKYGELDIYEVIIPAK